MTIKPTTLLFLLLLSATLALSHHPERLQQCMDQCEKVYRGQELEFQCKRMCEEQQIKPEPARRGDDPWEKQHLRSCKDKCKDLGRPRKEHCEQDCEDKYKRGDGNSQGEGDNQNPYFFGRESFKDWVRSQHGRIQILERFDERSELLAGIANYRVKILEAEPQTLVIPKHIDADELFYVANGEGVINLLREDSRESHELRQGHIFSVPAGTIVYIINKHNQQKLCLVKLLQPVSTPGEFETFFDAGGENPETYIRSFSDEVKEAAFNAPKEKIDRVFNKQSKGAILKVSRDQIEQLTRKSSSESGPFWPFGGGESQQGPFNLLGKPSHKNSRGEYYEVDESKYKQLKDLDIQISYANITGGSMMSPFFLSRATKVSVIISGKGFVEIVCPHLASQKSKRSEEEQQPRQQEQGQGQEEERPYGQQGKEQKRREQEQEQQHGQQGREQEQEQGRQGSEQGKEQKRREQEQGEQGREKEHGRQGEGQKRREQEQEQEQQEQEQGHHGREQKQGPRYQRARSNVSQGTVVVTPAGHPSVWVASKGENLEVLCFEINARNNQRNSLAGEDNILKKLQDVAMELAYGTSAKEVNALFDAQDKKMFVAGPEERKEGRGGKGPLESVMDFADF